MFKLKYFAYFLLVSISIIFASCTQEEALPKLEESATLDFYSKEDINLLKTWVTTQRTDKLSDFPELSFKAAPSSTDPEDITPYAARIMTMNQEILEGKTADYEQVIEDVREARHIDENGKIQLLSFIQMSAEFLTSKEVVQHYKKIETQNSNRETCNCDEAYDTYAQWQAMCNAFGNFHDCQKAQQAYDDYQDCLAQENHCPSGFTLDGAGNCASGVYVPAGYSPFIWGTGFYVNTNCSISEDNCCCPNNYKFDGANCRYKWKSFPSNYSGFIYGNAFYVDAECY